MGTTRTERAKDPGGCGGEDRGLWGSGGRLSPHGRASRRGDSRLSRGDGSGTDRHGRSRGRRDKEGAYGQRLRLGCPARTLPRVGGARGVRPLSRTSPPAVLAPSGWDYAELRVYGVLRSSCVKPRTRTPSIVANAPSS